MQGDALLELTEPRKLDRGDESFPSAARPRRPLRRARRGRQEEGAGAARRAVEAFEAALGGPGWRAHLDEASAVDYVLHAELLKNQDAFHSSTYLHHREDGMLALGPVWDFDLSAGNVVVPALAPPEGWLLPGRDVGGRAAGRPRLPGRAGRALARAAGGRPDRVPAGHRRRPRAHAAGAGAAQLRALARRSTAPVFADQPVHGSHAAAVAALKDWIARRAAWIDGALGR